MTNDSVCDCCFMEMYLVPLLLRIIRLEYAI